MTAQTMIEGFEKFVVKTPEGCWDWKGCAPVNPGYGQFRTQGKLIRAHRASWEIHFGTIPEGLYVCHTCDNMICSNPKHLFLATCKENNLDMMRKGRSPILGKKGENNPHAKLTRKQVIQIRKLLKAKHAQTEIASKFGVSQTAISVINRNRYWR